MYKMHEAFYDIRFHNITWLTQKNADIDECVEF